MRGERQIERERWIESNNGALSKDKHTGVLLKVTGTLHKVTKIILK